MESLGDLLGAKIMDRLHSHDLIRFASSSTFPRWRTDPALWRAWRVRDFRDVGERMSATEGVEIYMETARVDHMLRRSRMTDRREMRRLRRSRTTSFSPLDDVPTCSSHSWGEMFMVQGDSASGLRWSPPKTKPNPNPNPNPHSKA